MMTPRPRFPLRRLLPVLLVPLLLAPFARAAEPPPVRVERVEEILTKLKPILVRLTKMKWPAGLTVERTDPAGLKALLYEEFLTEVAALHPERPASSKRLLADALARSFSRVVRAKYGLATKKIHVSPGALDRLPESVTPDAALIFLVAHEAVHAMDDAAVPLAERIRAAAADPEQLRALRMVIEGRAEYYGPRAAGELGVAESVGPALAAGRDPGERLTREAGARFIAALSARDPALPRRALEHPPVTTSTVFHPGRYPDGEPAVPDLTARLGRALPGGRAEALSELLLRRSFLAKLSPDAVEKAFSGFVSALAVNGAGGTRVSLAAATDEAAADRFLTGLAAMESAPVKDRAATRQIAGPGGRLYSWAARARGSLVAEAVAPPGTDVAPLLAAALTDTGD